MLAGVLGVKPGTSVQVRPEGTHLSRYPHGRAGRGSGLEGAACPGPQAHPADAAGESVDGGGAAAAADDDDVGADGCVGAVGARAAAGGAEACDGTDDGGGAQADGLGHLLPPCQAKPSAGRRLGPPAGAQGCTAAAGCCRMAREGDGSREGGRL
eukprot:scaffold29174_cov34-Prasinocladus_malaysianus.AAC.1